MRDLHFPAHRVRPEDAGHRREKPPPPPPPPHTHTHTHTPRARHTSISGGISHGVPAIFQEGAPPSVGECVKRIMADGGVKNFWRGITPLIIQGFVEKFCYFLPYSVIVFYYEKRFGTMGYMSNLVLVRPSLCWQSAPRQIRSKNLAPSPPCLGFTKKPLASRGHNSISRGIRDERLVVPGLLRRADAYSVQLPHRSCLHLHPVRTTKFWLFLHSFTANFC